MRRFPAFRCIFLPCNVPKKGLRKRAEIGGKPYQIWIKSNLFCDFFVLGPFFAGSTRRFHPGQALFQPGDPGVVDFFHSLSWDLGQGGGGCLICPWFVAIFAQNRQPVGSYAGGRGVRPRTETAARSAHPLLRRSAENVLLELVIQRAPDGSTTQFCSCKGLRADYVCPPRPSPSPVSWLGFPAVRVAQGTADGPPPPVTCPPCPATRTAGKPSQETGRPTSPPPNPRNLKRMTPSHQLMLTDLTLPSPVGMGVVGFQKMAMVFGPSRGKRK